MAYINGTEILFSADVKIVGDSLKTEVWTLTLDDGSTVEKEVYIGDD